MPKPAVFLDRDGVINCNRSDYVRAWSDFEFLPGALGALCKLGDLGWPVVVVTNQSAVGRGLMCHWNVQDVHRRMVAAVRYAGGRIDTVFYCSHRPEDGCACRKPRPGLLLAAEQSLDLDLANSFLVGDGAGDILAAQAAGCRPILVKSGLGQRSHEELLRKGIDGFLVAEDLPAAVDLILRQAIAVTP
jgi:D-glycero-D-manno-heptose 1,7-bisphosphate phosphatase